MINAVSQRKLKNQKSKFYNGLGNTNNYYRRDQSPILKSSITREIRSIAKSDSKKAKKMTEKELELERKMDRKGQNRGRFQDLFTKFAFSEIRN